MNTYEEITLVAPRRDYAEMMIHVEDGGKVVRAYVYKQDVEAGIYPPKWTYKDSTNSLFAYIDPLPANFRRRAAAAGFIK